MVTTANTLYIVGSAASNIRKPTVRPTHESDPARRRVGCVGSYRLDPDPGDDRRPVLDDHHLGHDHSDPDRAVPLGHGIHDEPGRRRIPVRREYYGPTSGRRPPAARADPGLRDIAARHESARERHRAASSV